MICLFKKTNALKSRTHLHINRFCKLLVGEEG